MVTDYDITVVKEGNSNYCRVSIYGVPDTCLIEVDSSGGNIIKNSEITRLVSWAFNQGLSKASVPEKWLT